MNRQVEDIVAQLDALQKLLDERHPGKFEAAYIRGDLYIRRVRERRPVVPDDGSVNTTDNRRRGGE